MSSPRCLDASREVVAVVVHQRHARVLRAREQQHERERRLRVPIPVRAARPKGAVPGIPREPASRHGGGVEEREEVRERLAVVTLQQLRLRCVHEGAEGADTAVR